ncbi:MAG: hypothetical protein HY722_12010 [Planctomycetes bacterium]|nr:hypothetical protein [Planctomycetota bacterium]
MSSRAGLASSAWTGVGSLPHREPGPAMAHVLAAYPELPFVPQLPRRHPDEDLRAQAGRDGLDPSREAGWGAALEAARAGAVRVLKVQVTGPATAGEDPPRTARRAAGCARRIAEAGALPVVFLDEPLLGPGGTANLEPAIEAARAAGAAAVGVHCCALPPWAEYLASTADWVSVDTGRYLGSLLGEAAGELTRRLDEGRAMAWGLVPTGPPAAGLDPEVTAEALVSALEGAGVRVARALAGSLLTGACGTGLLPIEAELGVARALSSAAAWLRRQAP